MGESQRHKKLGLFLKRKRMDAGFSQGDIGKRLGYSSPQFISNFERGNCAPPLKTLKELVKIYNIEVDEVIRLMLQEQEAYLRERISSNDDSLFSQQN